MKFCPLALPGPLLIEPECLTDERGFFARLYCEEVFREQGVPTCFPQCNLSFNARKGTLRGMHFQTAQYAEAKLVRCTRGSVYDVLLDLREGKESFGQWVAVELSFHKPQVLYIPEGFAHGFYTLEDETELFYQMSSPYVPEASAGVRWNDPAFKILWPTEVPEILSDKDRSYPDYEERS